MKLKLRENYELIFEKLQENGTKDRNDFILDTVIIRNNSGASDASAPLVSK